MKLKFKPEEIYLLQHKIVSGQILSTKDKLKINAIFRYAKENTNMGVPQKDD